MGGGAKQPPQPRPNIAEFRHTTLHSLMHRPTFGTTELCFVSLILLTENAVA
jgi:hypothetical protein